MFLSWRCISIKKPKILSIFILGLMVINAVLELSKSPVLTVKNTKDYDFKIIPATINFNLKILI